MASYSGEYDPPAPLSSEMDSTDPLSNRQSSALG